ncbi:hypothetical protein ISF_09270 [Cordyceps fumosorosea ARSEF 2679]|uniref:Uncharacterized protein n=1 Tax=Cordyceps fumosorosea (strain ARSEF 2679) TaxID=1081104 RepID=A0A167LBG6_CORFA|nr:hypothetical protein ISF_09270 [Cordyceps fumosorosea ARSEF 2679]OAA52887.1 hypothetical protein ISF_09270 [Cordyceps fumosorosea ARSEF 2679]
MGIKVLMWGAAVPTIYYDFVCELWLQIFYWAMASSSALCCAVFTFTPSLVTP